MTQKKDSIAVSGDQKTPTEESSQAKKKPAPTRKAAAPKKKAAADAAKTKIAEKKPRATAKAAAEKKVTAPKAPAKKPDKKSPEPEAKQQQQSAPKAEPVAKTAAAPARTKKATSTAGAPKAPRTAKKAATKETAKPTKTEPDSASITGENPAATSPSAKQSAAATPEKEKAPKAKPRSRGTAAKRSTPEDNEKKSTTAPLAAKASIEQSPPLTPEPAAETQPPAGEGQPARPASRRSRRGGRRRNKGKAVAQANGNADHAPPHADTAEEEPLIAADAPLPTENAETFPEREEREFEEEQIEADQEKTVPERTSSSSKRKMFISVLSGELIEVVLAENGVVLEYYVEMLHQAKVKGNIYKGTVSNIDANLQAAFISYAGGVKNGFLQIDEVHPEYYFSHQEPAKNRKYPPIQKILKPGQELLVQVVKEPSGTKGAFLTSYLSLPGRFLVLTPGREQIGVSRKVDDEGERSRLRSMLEGLTPGKGLGVIVRTVSEGASKTSLQRDLQFLKRLWKEVRSKGQSAEAPSLIYEELDLSTRAIRDYLTDDVSEVWVDDAETAKQMAELAALLFPKKRNLVQVHSDNGSSLFERFSLQKQLEQINSREVALPSGGRLVFDNTEALTAIDINSGRSSGKSNFEDMAFRTNLEAASAIPLQLRLRDIGGQVVADFIEMRDKNHWRDVEKAVRNGMKGDRARYDVGKIGPFGMLEIVRQRLGSSAISLSTESCPCCKGTGIRRNIEWRAMQALRDVRKQMRQASANKLASLSYHAETELAVYLLNAKRGLLQNLEEELGVSLTILPKLE